MRALRDNDDEAVALLQQIAKNTGGTVLDSKKAESNAEDKTAEYFSTGPNRYAVTEGGDTFDKIEFGLLAQSINLRTTDDVVLAFQNPQNTGNQIRVRADESPFTIGGYAGIDTNVMWVQQAESATDTPYIEIIAYR